MPSASISAVAVGDGGQSEAAPMGFTVTAASVGDYRPRLDRRVARSKARPADREVRRKEARERAAMKHPHSRTVRSHTPDGGRDQKPAAEKRKKFTVDVEGGGTRGTYRNPVRNREKTRG